MMVEKELQSPLAAPISDGAWESRPKFRVLRSNDTVAHSRDGRYRLELTVDFVAESNGRRVPKPCLQIQRLDAPYSGSPIVVTEYVLPRMLQETSINDLLDSDWFTGLAPQIENQLAQTLPDLDAGLETAA